MTEALEATRRLLSYIDASPTPFHAVAESQRLLEAAGYSELSEAEAWELIPGDKRYVIRNQSTLIAFEVGQLPPVRGGFRLIGAHTDSPNLRLKPKPEFVKENYRQLGVEPYGGVLLATWLDRDLSLAGRVLVEGEASPRLLKVERTLCRVPNVAIHLNREVNSKGLLVNKQKHLPPVIGLGGKDDAEGWLHALLAQELGIDAGQIEGWDLQLYDVVPSVVSGFDEELIHAPRLDNLASCHAALEALCSVANTPAEHGRVVALYDHEEVGSRSAEGADSPFLASVLERIVLSRGGGAEDLHRAKAKSAFLSADMAHAVHPNYSDLSEPHHMPRLNEGPVLKTNNNMRYATNAVSSRLFTRACQAAEVPLQHFVNRSDLACGSTIGPITAARLGIPTADVGNPMLSMHSVREMAGSQDHDAMTRAMSQFLTLV
ncbi:MAG TPA: M18 family aminopeptidase [Planctomycetes bacterium]|nr:M18 family aminopeptidase [Planctomycetota bacterium]